MILVNRLEKYAERRGFFSKMKFGFQEGVGCIEASFITLETINHMLERGSKIFSISAKHLTWFGLTVCFVSYLQNWVSTVECGLQYAISKIRMLCDLYCLKARLKLRYNELSKANSMNLVSRQVKLCNIFIFVIAYQKNCTRM